MESAKVVSSGFPLLPTEPPDPDLGVILPVNPPVPPVPPDPPQVLLVCMLSVQPLLMNPLLAEVALSSSLTTSQVSSFLQLIPVLKPRNLVSCVEHD